ncbi:MAG: hypothetical protein AABZ02_01410 [Bacteroidota bacterium]
MASRKQKKSVQIKQIIEKLKSMGAHELTEEEKKLPWHEKDIAEFESYLRRKREQRLGVRETKSLI